MLQNVLFLAIIVALLSSIVIYTMASNSKSSKSNSNKKKPKGPDTNKQDDLPQDGTAPGTSNWISSTQMDLLQPKQRPNTRSSTASKSTELLHSKLNSVDSSDSETEPCQLL